MSAEYPLHCTVSGCDQLACGRCEICDAPRCNEHAVWTDPPGSRFCATRGGPGDGFYCEEVA